MHVKRFLALSLPLFVLFTLSAPAFSAVIVMHPVKLEGGKKTYLARGVEEVLSSKLTLLGHKIITKSPPGGNENAYVLKCTLKTGKGVYSLSASIRDKDHTSKTFSYSAKQEDGILEMINGLAGDVDAFIKDYQGPLTSNAVTIVDKTRIDLKAKKLPSIPGPKENAAAPPETAPSSAQNTEDYIPDLAPDLPPDEKAKEETDGTPRASKGIFALFSRWKKKRQPGKTIQSLPPYVAHLPVPSPEELEGKGGEKRHLL